MKKSTKFAWSFRHVQLPSHCGPCSLAVCLFILGIDTNQTKVAKSIGEKTSIKIFKNGTDDKKLIKASKKYNIKSIINTYKSVENFNLFIEKIKTHLKNGNPVVLLINDFQHWVSIIGYINKKFIIFDPINKFIYKWNKNKIFTKSWNNYTEEAKEKPQFFSILLKNKYNKKPKWEINEKLIRYYKKGIIPSIS